MLARGPHDRPDRTDRRLRSTARNGAAGTGPGIAVRGPWRGPCCHAVRMGVPAVGRSVGPVAAGVVLVIGSLVRAREPRGRARRVAGSSSSIEWISDPTALAADAAQSDALWQGRMGNLNPAPTCRRRLVRSSRLCRVSVPSVVHFTVSPVPATRRAAARLSYYSCESSRDAKIPHAVRPVRPE